jgi:hypothetical protein
MIARDGNYIPIVIKGNRSMLGRFLDIESTDMGPTYLIGRVDDQ